MKTQTKKEVWDITEGKKMKQKYKTTDMGLASALMALNYQIEVEPFEGRKCYFVCDEDKDLQKIVNDYWNCKLKIIALKLWNATKMLKAKVLGITEHYNNI